jgi:hypothetical protein
MLLLCRRVCYRSSRIKIVAVGDSLLLHLRFVRAPRPLHLRHASASPLRWLKFQKSLLVARVLGAPLSAPLRQRLLLIAIPRLLTGTLVTTLLITSLTLRRRVSALGRLTSALRTRVRPLAALVRLLRVVSAPLPIRLRLPLLSGLSIISGPAPPLPLRLRER